MAMEWSNLNEEMIEGFFASNESPTNAEISLNFTRTSRESSDNKQKAQVVAINQQALINKCSEKQTDALEFAQSQLAKEIQKTDKVSFETLDSLTQKNASFDFSKAFLSTEKQYNHTTDVKTDIFHLLEKGIQKNRNLIISNKKDKCENCTVYLQEIQSKSQIINELQTKLQQITRNHQAQIASICLQNLQNKKQSQKLIQRLRKDLSQSQQTLQQKQQYVSRLKQQIEKYSLQNSTYHVKNKTLENRLLQLQKTKSHSAAKNSTSHTDFSKGPESLLIHTNQFNDKFIDSEDYIGWFQKVKSFFLEQYKKQEKEHLSKLQSKNADDMKQVVKQFRKGHVRYEIARSCKTILDYIKKNKDNFLEMIQELGRQPLKQKGLFYMQRSTNKVNEEHEQEIKKLQKINLGQQSQIANLNNQLDNVRKHLMNEKKAKKCYVEEKEKSISLLQEEIETKKKQLVRLTKNIRKIQEINQNIEVTAKQGEYALYRERKQKIKLLNEIVTLKGRAFSICRIKTTNNNEHQKHHQISPLNEFQLIINDQQNISFKFDKILSNSSSSSSCLNNNKSLETESLQTKRLIQSCFYGSDTLFCTFEHSQQQQQIESWSNSAQNYIMKDKIQQVFRLKEAQKRYLTIQISLQMIQMTNQPSQIVDLLDFEEANRKISLKKDHEKIYLSNCNILPIDKIQEFKKVLANGLKNRKTLKSHVFTIFKLSFNDRRTKEKYESRLVFANFAWIQKQDSTENVELHNDLKAIKKAITQFNQKSSLSGGWLQQNRVTYLLSDSLRNIETIIESTQQSTKRQTIIQMLSYGSSLSSSLLLSSTPTPTSTPTAPFKQRSKSYSNTNHLTLSVNNNQSNTKYMIPIPKHIHNQSASQSKSLQNRSVQNKEYQNLTPNQNTSQRSTPYITASKGSKKRSGSQQHVMFQQEDNSCHHYSVDGNNRIIRQENQQPKKRTISRLSIS